MRAAVERDDRELVLLRTNVSGLNEITIPDSNQLFRRINELLGPSRDLTRAAGRAKDIRIPSI